MNKIREKNRRRARQVDDNEIEAVDFSKRIEDIFVSLNLGLPIDGSAEMDPNEVAFAILVTGSITKKALEFLNWCGRVAPARNRLNLALSFIGERIIKMALKSCQDAFEKLELGSTISFDGSWEHRRNSHRCIVDVCCQKTGQVIAYQIMSNLIPEDRREYCKFPQNMEVAGLRILLPSLMESKAISRYCHDNDAKIKGVL
jgi:hypothetical protein